MEHLIVQISPLCDKIQGSAIRVGQLFCGEQDHFQQQIDIAFRREGRPNLQQRFHPILISAPHKIRHHHINFYN